MSKCARGDGEEATYHVFWNEWRDGALLCDDHTQQAYRYVIHDIHPASEVCVDECPMLPAAPAGATPGRLIETLTKGQQESAAHSKSPKK